MDTPQQATAYVAHILGSGQSDLFILRQYKDKKAEFAHFGYLLKQDLLSSVIMEVDDTIRRLFKPGDPVWLQYKKEGINITEATQENELAHQEVAIVREKMKAFPMDLPEEKTSKIEVDGQRRFTCISAYYKDN